jgi:hypothetical protein
MKRSQANARWLVYFSCQALKQVSDYLLVLSLKQTKKSVSLRLLSLTIEQANTCLFAWFRWEGLPPAKGGKQHTSCGLSSDASIFLPHGVISVLTLPSHRLRRHSTLGYVSPLISEQGRR